MGLSLGAFTEWMDKIFGGPEEKRGIIQAIILIVVGIILEVIPVAVSTAAGTLIFTNPTLAAQLAVLAIGLGWLSWVGGILITLGIIGIVWFVLRKLEWIE